MGEAIVTVRKLQAAIDEYCKKWRKPGLSEIKLSAVYDLIDDWNDGNPWPNPGDTGIYAILDANKKLLYLGKASMGSSIAKRLSAWFKYRPDRSFRTNPRHTWNHKPFFVVSAAVDKEAPWEASALEEFLIHKLDPPENSKGRP